MPRVTGKLTKKQCESALPPGRHGDGGGLYLEVEPSGSKRWTLRVAVKGRRRDLGLGGFSWVSLAEAREKAREMRKIARDGGDPVADRKRDVPTFSALAEEVHRSLLPTWKNAKHGAQFISTLAQYAFPVIGHLTVDRVTSAELYEVLNPIWTEKHETARRVRQRIHRVLEVAKARRFVAGENPADQLRMALPKVAKTDAHHEALPWKAVPAFVAALKAREATAALALRFLILTAARTGEVLGMRWGEVDLDAGLWTVPALRMKAKREHRVPLSPEALAILAEMRGGAASPAIPASDMPPDALVFEGQKRGRPLSNMAMDMLLRRMEQEVTVHGFRSSFRDWATEAAHAQWELAESCLAHAVGSKTEQAYARSDMLERRRDLMEQWGRSVLGEQAQVVKLSRGA